MEGRCLLSHQFGSASYARIVLLLLLLRASKSQWAAAPHFVPKGFQMLLNAKSSLSLSAKRVNQLCTSLTCKMISIDDSSNDLHAHTNSVFLCSCPSATTICIDIDTYSDFEYIKRSNES